MKFNKLFLSIVFATNSVYAFAGQQTAKQVKPIEPIMVTIPSGSFDMGDENGEDTKPVHKVSIPSFSLGKYEVTVREFRQFVEATGYQMPNKCTHQLDGWFIGQTDGDWQSNDLTTNDFQPVVCIGWKAADAYTKWLAKETNRPYRLPSEAEWEYAAKAGTKTKYYFGDDPDQTKVCEFENTADLTGENILQRDANTSYVNFYNDKSNCVDHSAYASVVGMYKPNQFGLHDMISNVLEFMADCYQNSYQGAPTDGSAWLAGTCEQHVTRGGSWHWNTFEPTNRGRMNDFVGGVDGFRVALDGKAPALSKRTKYFANELSLTQQREQLNRSAMPTYPEPVKNLTLKQTNEMVTLTWDKSTEEDIEGYRIYRNAYAGRPFKLLAANLTDTTFKDANVDPIKYEYTVVAVRRHHQSDYSKTASTKAPTTNLPGRLEAEAASEISGTSAANTSDTSGKLNLTGRDGIGAEAVMKYDINVTKAGHYALSYRVATPRDTKGFKLFVNGQEKATAIVAKTGGYHEWQTQQGEQIYLEQGTNSLTIKSLDNNWKLNWLAFNGQ